MRIFVDGSDYDAYFLLRGDTVKLPTQKEQPGWTDRQSVLFRMSAGVSYLRAALEEISAPGNEILVPEQSPFNKSRPQRLFEIHAQKHQVPDYEHFGEKLPFLDSHDEESTFHSPPWTAPAGSDDNSRKSGNPTESDILIERLAGGELQPERETQPEAESSKKAGATCGIHIQIGRSNLRGSVPPVQAAMARCIILSLSDLVDAKRIRKSISYESIVVDILRLLRDYNYAPQYSALFDRLAGTCWREDTNSRGHMPGGKPSALYIIVRINHAAVLVYQWRPPPFAAVEKAGTPAPEEKPDHAYLLFHQNHAAPFDDTKLGRFDGFSGFLAVHLAEQARLYYQNPPAQPEAEGSLPVWIEHGIKHGILWQVAQSRRGVLKLFFHDAAPAKGSTGPRAEALWSPIDAPDWNAERRQYFTELKRCLQNEEKWSDNNPENSRQRVHFIRVRVSGAVSHRMQWFLAADKLLADKLAADKLKDAKPTPDDPDASEFERIFTKVAEGWLTKSNSDPSKNLPLVKIGDLPLMDRREVEDYLALRDAIRNYEHGAAAKPLNIAVFGAPGAGKSFGVTQVVAQSAKVEGSRLQEKALTFNLSQFTSLHDLVTALQLVRNECLKDKIPVVFFDEFDSAFEGRPFGWLKYFLAPMQDGEFTDSGRTYKLGACVMVFAGGVNRSFEELNGRLRNPGFVEAKGPDFISRLRGHMNIRGINKPEDDVDQSRYILRRAIMLHGMLTRRLSLPAGNAQEHGLLEASVAHAFCGVASFKHGARSMEAILDMCDIKKGREIGPSDLPAKAQLEMHVDASEFINLIFKYAKDHP